jgi:putative aldouronate transport system substrate-binding protein
MQCLRKAVVLLLSVSIFMGLLAGCGGQTPSQSTPAASGNEATQAPDAQEPVAANVADDSGTVTFPLAEPLTLTAYIAMQGGFTLHLQTLNDHPVFKQREKDTNIHIDFVTTELSTLLASNTLPDMFFEFDSYPGGNEKAVTDGIIVDLREYMQYAPTYSALMEEYPEIGVQMVTDSGVITGFSTVHLSREVPWWGPFINKVKLDELNLAVPETIDEWYTALSAFKNAGIEKPFTPSAWDFKVSWGYGVFTGAYDTTYGFMNKDGAVKYGPIEPGFKDFLIEMNKWYAEGLIDPDFATPDYGAISTSALNNELGALCQVYYPDQISNPENGVEMVAVPYPKLDKNDTLHVRQSDFQIKNSNGIAVSTVNKHIPETVAWADYGFTDDGFLLYNYGIEGESWVWADGPANNLEKSMMPASLIGLDRHPVIDLSGKANPNNIPESELRYISVIHPTYGFLRTPYSYFDQTCADVATIWMESAGDDWVMPNVTHTAEEASEIASVLTDIETYVDENVIQFILGLRDISEYDDYVAQVNSMGMEMILAHKQAALERYNNR